MNSEDIVKRLEDAANKWVISHNGAKENSCGLVALAREAANLIEYLQAQLAESKRRERAAVEDLQKVMPRWACKNRNKDFCPISDVTGVEDCVYCGEWQWRGTKEGELNETV